MIVQLSGQRYRSAVICREYAYTSRIGSTVQVEHFWLCGECHVDYDFIFSKDGAVSLVSRPKFVVAQAKAELDLMLVS